MATRIFKVNQRVKLETGEPVNVVEVIPIGMTVFYRIEDESGQRRVVVDAKLREIFRDSCYA